MKASDIRKSSPPTGTRFDRLPSDVIDYLKGFSNTTLNVKYGTSKFESYIRSDGVIAWEKNVTDDTILKEANLFYNNRGAVQKGKVVAIDGRYYVLVPAHVVEKSRPKYKKQSQCKEHTTLDKRCKKRTRDITKVCSVHRKKIFYIPNNRIAE